MELNLNKMKAIHYIILCATILISYSCTKEIIENHAPSIAGTEETFLAYNADDASTKTVLKEDGSINWLSSDKINLFYGKDYSTTFECKSTTPDENGFATFHGSLEGCEENNESFFFAVYPYSAGNSFDGVEATITLPSEQIAVANTFADDLFISVAQTKDRTLSFYNVCGGVKFSVARNGVTQIKFRGNNNETLAGTASIWFNENGLPEIRTGSMNEKEITVNAPSSDGFLPGVYYYIVAFPSELTKGYTITYCVKKRTYISSNDKTATYKESIETPVRIKRSTFGRLTKVGPTDDAYIGDVSLIYNSDIIKFKDYKKIIGNLTIGGNAITTLTGLDNNLEIIYGDVNIDCSTLTTLDGLYGLRTVIGKVDINCKSLPSLEGLNNLQYVEDNLTLTNVNSFRGLDSIEELHSGLIIKGGNMTSFEGLEKLRLINGNLEVLADLLINNEDNNETLRAKGIYNLQNFKGLSNLEYIGGSFVIKVNTNSTSWRGRVLPNLKDFEGLDRLKRIGGSLSIATTVYQSQDVAYFNVLDSLTSFHGLNNLSSIGGFLAIKADIKVKSTSASPITHRGFTNLSSLEGFDSLTEVGGISITKSILDSKVNLTFLPNLHISGLHSLQKVKGSINITTGLGEFDSLENLSSVGGSILIQSDFSDIDGFNKLNSVNGDIVIGGETTATFNGFNNLETISGNMEISGFKTFGAFSSLQSIGGNCFLSSMPSLKEIKSTARLTTIGGNLSINGLSSLSDISGLSNVEHGVANISVKECPQLFNFEPLVKAAQNMAGTWYVTGCGYNPTKYQMLNGKANPQE